MEEFTTQGRSIIDKTTLSTCIGGRITGSSTWSNEYATCDGKTILITINTFFRSTTTWGDNESAIDGDGTIGIYSIVSRRIAIDTSVINNELAFSINTIIIRFGFYRTSIDG